MANLIEIKGRLQEALDKGVASVEEIHTTIASQPLKVLENIDILAGPVKQAKEFQEKAISSLYGMIRNVTQAIGKFVDGLLEKLPKEKTDVA